MIRSRKTVFAAASAIALALAPMAPATAAGVFLPWLIGRHVVGAVVGLATLPLAVAAALSEGQPAAPNPQPPDYGYGGRPSGYYPPPNYYAPPPAYYAGQQRYYRSADFYGRSGPRFYETPRGYYAPRTRYTGAYGAHVPYQSGRSAYRRR